MNAEIATIVLMMLTTDTGPGEEFGGRQFQSFGESVPFTLAQCEEFAERRNASDANRSVAYCVEIPAPK